MMKSIYWILFLFTLAYVRNEKVCPLYGDVGNEYEYREDCFDQCQPDDDKCGINKKCCFVQTNPCGYRCIIPKDNREKSGFCPSADSFQINILWSMCDIRLCDVDNDCSADEKCCTNICRAKMCLKPNFSRKKRSFSSLKI